jgi:hypothetical protein
MCSIVLRGVRLVVSDIGDAFWEPTTVNGFENADVEYSKSMPDLDACFKKDTVLVNELLDRLKHIPEADSTRLMSHLLANRGSSSGISWFLPSVVCLVYPMGPPDSVMHNTATIYHGVDHVTTRALAHK